MKERYVSRFIHEWNWSLDEDWANYEHELHVWIDKLAGQTDTTDGMLRNRLAKNNTILCSVKGARGVLPSELYITYILYNFRDANRLPAIDGFCFVVGFNFFLLNNTNMQ